MADGTRSNGGRPTRRAAGRRVPQAPPPPEHGLGAGGNPLTDFIHNSPFFLISLVLHIVILMLLALVVAREPMPRRRRLVVMIEEMLRAPEELPPLRREDRLFDAGGGGMAGAGSAGMETFVAARNRTRVVRPGKINVLGLDAPAGAGSGGDFAGEGGEGFGLAPGKGDSTMGGAVDQFAIITLNSMARGKTLVVLLVDRSRSIIYDDLPRVVRRMDHYFDQIENNIPVGCEDRGRWVVVGYGRTHRFICNPSKDLGYVKNALASVKVDESGLENIGKAVEAVVKRFGDSEYKYLLIAAMTDEAGDDINDPRGLEKVIKDMRKVKARFYVFGYESTFCARKKRITFKLDPSIVKGADRAAIIGFEGRTIYGWADGGPEAARPELWWCVSDAADQGWWAWQHWGGSFENIPSGFGMYGLNRMVLATNGIYFLLNPESKYDEETLYAKYKPDICSMFEYDKRIVGDPVRRELKEIWKELGYYHLSWDLRSTQQVQTVLGKSLQGRRFCIERAKRLDKVLETSRPTGRNAQRWQAHAELTRAELLRMRFMLGQYHEALKRGLRDAEGVLPEDMRFVMRRGKAPDDYSGPKKAREEYEIALHYIDEVTKKHTGTPWEVMGKRLRQDVFPWRCSLEEIPKSSSPPQPPALAF